MRKLIILLIFLLNILPSFLSKDSGFSNAAFAQAPGTEQEDDGTPKCNPNPIDTFNDEDQINCLRITYTIERYVACPEGIFLGDGPVTFISSEPLLGCTPASDPPELDCKGVPGGTAVDKGDCGCMEQSEECEPMGCDNVRGSGAREVPGCGCLPAYQETCNGEQEPPVIVDCKGVVNGTAVNTPCGCLFEFENCVQDCNKVWGGTAYLDDYCNCVGGDTGNTPNANPKKGDPLKVMEIAPTQSGSVGGGRNGWTRYRNGTPRYHDGIDVKGVVSEPFNSMYDGVVVDVGTSTSYGNYVIVKSTIPGRGEVYLKYNHLSDVLVNDEDPVTTNDHLGLVGKTGNASGSDTVPHIHIQMRPANDFGLGSWSNYTAKDIDPEQLLNTKFDIDGNPIQEPCN